MIVKYIAILGLAATCNGGGSFGVTEDGDTVTIDGVGPIITPEFEESGSDFEESGSDLEDGGS